MKAKDVVEFVGAASYTFLYDVIPGAEFVGGRPEELVSSRASYEGAAFGHSAALSLAILEIGHGIGTGLSAAGVGGVSVAASAVPGGQVLTAIGVPAAVAVAGAATAEVALGGYTAMKAVKGQERLKARIVRESPDREAAAAKPAEKAKSGSEPTTEPATQEPPKSGVYEVRGEVAGKKKSYVGSGFDTEQRPKSNKHPAREILDEGENVTVTHRPVDLSDAASRREQQRILRTNEQVSLNEVRTEGGENINKINARAPKKFERDLPKYGDRRQAPRVQPVTPQESQPRQPQPPKQEEPQQP